MIEGVISFLIHYFASFMDALGYYLLMRRAPFFLMHLLLGPEKSHV